MTEEQANGSPQPGDAEDVVACAINAHANWQEDGSPGGAGVIGAMGELKQAIDAYMNREAGPRERVSRGEGRQISNE